MIFDPFQVAPSGLNPATPGEVIADWMLKLRTIYPLLHALSRFELGISVLLWGVLIAVPARNPWWRWAGWLILFGAIVSFTVIQYLPVIEYYTLRGTRSPKGLP